MSNFEIIFMMLRVVTVVPLVAVLAATLRDWKVSDNHDGLGGFRIGLIWIALGMLVEVALRLTIDLVGPIVALTTQQLIERTQIVLVIAKVVTAIGAWQFARILLGKNE